MGFLVESLCLGVFFWATPPVRLGLSGRNSGKIPERPRKRSQSVSWNFPREYGWDAPNPIIQGIWGFQSISRILSPPVRLGTLFFSEVVLERASQSRSWNSQQYWVFLIFGPEWYSDFSIFEDNSPRKPRKPWEPRESGHEHSNTTLNQTQSPKGSAELGSQAQLVSKFFLNLSLLNYHRSRNHYVLNSWNILPKP